MLFVGAGLSAAAGLPTWRGLLDDVIATTGEGSEGAPETGELRALLGAGKLLEVAEHCRAKDPQRFNEVLRRRLAVDGVDVPRAHRAIVGLPFAAVVTTNFDRLLERAYETLAHTGAPRAPTYDQLPTLGTLLFEGAFFILKAHGDIGAPDNLVITATDYREISHANPAFADIFSAILLTRAILFVGYSLSDPDFRLLFDRQLTAFPGALPPRYALMTGVGAVEREILKKTAQIQVLPYEVVDGRHDAVPAFLERLREMVATAPAPAVSPLAVEQAGGRKTTATSTTSRTRRAPARVAAAPREPPRPAPPLPVTTLELRRRGASLEAAVVAGDERLASTSRRPLPPWSHWARVIPPALSGYDDGWDARLRAAGAELADMLTEAALGALARVPAEHVIVLRPSPELETLPWEWTLVEGEHLSIRWPVVRAPVGVSESARGHPSVRWPPRALFIGDPRGPTSPSLPGALKEVEDIGRLYDAGTRTILVGGDDDESRGAAPRRGRRRPRPATYANVMAELRGGAYDIVHFAGHAWFDASESFLELHDGLVWTNELRTLLSPHPPAVLVLNSHYTAFVPPGVRTTEGAGGAAGSAGAAVNPAADPRGFVRMAGATGVGAFVGCFGTPLDEAAQHVGFTLHQRLLQGEPVAWALHRARQAGLAFGRARGDMTALLYTASGYPELRVSG